MVATGMSQCFACEQRLHSSDVPVVYHVLLALVPVGLPDAYREQVVATLRGRMFASCRYLAAGSNFDTQEMSSPCSRGSASRSTAFAGG